MKRETRHHRPEPTDLRAMGGQYEAQALIHRPRSPEELAEVFTDAGRRGVRLTLVGGRRSFGEHFLPPVGAEAVDTTGLGGTTRVLESDDAGLWVHAPGSTTFEQLARQFPDCFPRDPPTGDRITLAGALSACSHSSAGYFADGVRAFTLMTPDGRCHRCAPGASGLGRELFGHVPGSFGALGAVLDLELRLWRFPSTQRAEVTVLGSSGPGELEALVDHLEAASQSGAYPLGRGIFLVGRKGRGFLLGDRLVVPSPGQTVHALPLANDALALNIYLQGLAHRFPGPVQRLMPRTFPVGRRFHAGLYAFLYFQQSYDRAHDLLASDAAPARLLRALGVDPHLTVCHTTFAIPARAIHPFLKLYLERFEAFAEIEGRLEQQDLIRLPECRWPLHGTYGMDGGAYLLSPSFSVRRGTKMEARVRSFLAEVGQRAFAASGVKVLLLKQAHLEPTALARMHASFTEALGKVRAEVDPEGRLGSRLLDRVLDMRGVPMAGL